jgi:hypothetical protein
LPNFLPGILLNIRGAMQFSNKYNRFCIGTKSGKFFLSEKVLSKYTLIVPDNANYTSILMGSKGDMLTLLDDIAVDIRQGLAIFSVPGKTYSNANLVLFEVVETSSVEIVPINDDILE